MQAAADPTLREFYSHCRRIHRRKDPTYYWATRRLPAEVRPAVHAIYAFVRTVDDIVDGPQRPPDPAARRAALDRWELMLEDAVRAEGADSHPVAAALPPARAVGRAPVPAEEGEARQIPGGKSRVCP